MESNVRFAKPKSVSFELPWASLRHSQVSNLDGQRRDRGIRDRRTQVADEAGGLARGQGWSRIKSPRLRFHECHREIVLPLVLANLEHRNDPGVIEVGGGSGFGAESFNRCGRSQFAGEDHLQCDDAIEFGLPGFVNDPHAAASDHFDQLVLAKSLLR